MPVGAFSDRLLQARRAPEPASADDAGLAAVQCAAVGSGAKAAPATDPDVELGARLREVVRAAAKQEPLKDLPARERDALALLRALREGYARREVQAEVRRLQGEAVDELGFLTALAKVASKVQDPIFERYGLPLGQRGVMIMKMSIKVIGGHSATVASLAGDLRELLGLRREEEPQPLMASALRDSADAAFAELVAKIARAPVDVRGPLAEALRLPYKASPEEIARAVPTIRQIARQLADKNAGRPRAELAGDGKLLGPEALDASDERVHELLVASFEHYINKMLARVITPVDSFTQAPEAFRCPWAEAVVQPRHALELWGRRPASAQDLDSARDNEWLTLDVGITVIDNVVSGDLARQALEELTALESAGGLQESKDPCNVGARSVWLHFATKEERGQLPPVLGGLCDRLAGLPCSLLARAAAAAGEALNPPSLRVHPHVMAATYRKGAEYHVHKDSYSGADNQRMLTVLLYINDGWVAGDGGELRVHGTKQGSSSPAPDEDRFVDIAPLSGRLVIFRSREVWHAVREPRLQRWALTLWVMAD